MNQPLVATLSTKELCSCSGCPPCFPPFDRPPIQRLRHARQVWQSFPNVVLQSGSRAGHVWFTVHPVGWLLVLTNHPLRSPTPHLFATLLHHSTAFPLSVELSPQDGFPIPLLLYRAFQVLKRFRRHHVCDEGLGHPTVCREDHAAHVVLRQDVLSLSLPRSSCKGACSHTWTCKWVGWCNSAESITVCRPQILESRAHMS